VSENFVAWPPEGLIVAIQYWEGDEEPAMRLARCLADIEPARREDVTLALCRRFDCRPTALAYETYMHCGAKFRMMALQSRREGVGHPHGCNELWAGVMDQLSSAWSTGNLPHHSVFLVEPDGAPVRADWLNQIIAEHQRTLLAGRRITGPLTQHPLNHINGTLVAHFSLWQDRPSLHRTPSNQAWDAFHATVLMSEARPSPAIKNVYNGGGWSARALEAMARETSWITGTKDESAIQWAESLRRQNLEDAIIDRALRAVPRARG